MSDRMLNISGYRFVPLSDARDLQSHYRELCLNLALKGTIIFSPEGVNIGLAGPAEKIRAFVAALTQDSRFTGMIFKESWSDTAPYRRMFVKYKAMLVPSEEGIDPNQMTGKRLDPLELKRWLDEKKEVILIDTRNDYEFEYGSFANAVNLNIEHFRDFGDAVEQLPQDYRDKPVVMFCTGGIRCEKATPIAMKRGFNNVYQLEGGILDYFKVCEGAHWQGGCCVFDERVNLYPSPMKA